MTTRALVEPLLRTPNLIRVPPARQKASRWVTQRDLRSRRSVEAHDRIALEDAGGRGRGSRTDARDHEAAGVHDEHPRRFVAVGRPCGGRKSRR